MEQVASAATQTQQLPLPRLMADVETPEGPMQLAHLDVGSGAPVVFLHGLTATFDFWKANVRWVAQSRRAIALDLPGFGRSSKPDVSYSMPFFVRTLRAFFAQKGIERPTLIGNSMGGAIAMHYSLAFPDETAALVLVSPAGVTNYPRRLISGFMRLVAPALHQGRRAQGAGAPSAPRLPKEFGRLVFSLVFPSRADLAEKYAKAYAAGMASAEYPLYFRSGFRALEGVLDGHIGLLSKEIRTPTLIIWGKRDRLLPAWTAKRLHERIAGSELLFYERAGHCPMVDEAARFNRDVEDFLGRMGA